MKAVVYKDAYTVAVEDVPEPKLEDPRDVIVKITTTNICGSDLHMYESRTNVEQGKILGHQNMGVVAETGSAVENFRPGDRVSVPFNVACGTCYNCVHGWTSFCLRTNPTEGVDGGAYGYASMGPYAGGQAEYLRVPYAVSIDGGDPAEQIVDATGGMGADCGVEAVGYQAHDPAGDEHPELVMDWLVKSVRTTGRLGVIGVYMPQDPGAATEEAKDGRIAFDFGRLFQKGQSLGTGQCPVKRYNEQLRDLIIAGRATPSKIVSHELPLTEAPGAYDKFDKREAGYTKVILHPAA
jgi:threonine dehydrogenase-like Zn-dependent dehydrogenase